MRKLIVFNMVSLDGYFTDVKGDMSWATRYLFLTDEYVIARRLTP